MRVSVIVPIYNAEGSLHRCVDSILAQSFTDFELILVDDGSKDNSGAICDEYASQDNRVKVVHKKNGGEGSARNVGLGVAQGEWLTFCDADDYVEPELLSNLMVDVPDSDLIVSGAIAHYLNGEIKDVSYGRNQCEPADKLFPLIWENIYYGTVWGKLFKRDTIACNSLKFNEHIVLRVDEEFLLRYICRIKTISTVAGCYYHYFVPDWSKYGSVSNFDVSLSVWESVRAIGNFEHIERKFLTGTTNALFYAYEIGAPERLAYLKSYRACVGNQIKKIGEVSGFTKIIITSRIPSMIVSLVFDVKSRFTKSK